MMHAQTHRERSSSSSKDDCEMESSPFLDSASSFPPVDDRKPPLPPPPPQSFSDAAKLSAALFYATASLLTVFVAKFVLTTYSFPSATFLALSQFLLTALTFGYLGQRGYIALAPASRATLLRLLPLTCIFLLNVVSGLGGTKSLSLPMFTVLRRFSILFTMLLEARVFGKAIPPAVRLSVGMMIGGAAVAATTDLSFDLFGYAMILANDTFTALYGVTLRYMGLSISQNSLLFYNSLLSFFGLAFFMLVFQRSELVASLNFPGWSSPSFCLLYFLATSAGCILNLSIFLCTQRNSALTTSVIGCLKNVVTSYAGMGLYDDYIFSWANFFGLNISMLGSLLYSYNEIKKPVK